MTKYKALIGLEMHCEITNTNTKVFSRSKNSYEYDPNINVTPIDMGFPGTLPVVNKEAVKKALMMSMILGCKQPEYLYFERKNYYYPDLPKGYQITQETKPAPVGIYGEFEYELNGEKKVAKINNIHLEEDSASMEHFSDTSLIDYNRAGVPLLEMVTEPCFHSSEEAVAFLETIRSIYRYAGISEADSKKGQIRCDVNVSIMDEDLEEIPENFGTKVETKNVNSFSAVKGTIDYEIKRQIALKESGEYDSMPQQTRRWDENALETQFMRDKVDAIDYKYFIEPNIPRFKITDKMLEEVRKSIPVLADERSNKYINEYGIDPKDAKTLVREKEVSDYFERVVEDGIKPLDASNYVCNLILGSINKLDVGIDDFIIKSDMLSKLIKMVYDNKLSKNQLKNVIYKSTDSNKDPFEIIEEENIGLKEDTGEIDGIIDTIISEHQKEVEEYKRGRTNVINFMLGLVMKETRGQANPASVMEKLKEKLK